MRKLIACLPFFLVVVGFAQAPQYDVVIRHGTVYDGMGAAGRVEDVAITGDRIAARGDLRSARGRQEVDATGLAVAPGFITGRWLEQGFGNAYEGIKNTVAKACPLERVSDPQDVAEAIMSLVTGSKMVTGQVLVCDGGMLIGK